MNSMSYVKWPFLEPISTITLFALLTQINFAENITRALKKFQNEQNSAIPYYLNNPPMLKLDSSDEEIRLQRIQNERFQFSAILLTHNHEYPQRRKRGNLSPPALNYNSSFVMMQNLINKFQEELALMKANTSFIAENKARINALETLIKERQKLRDDLLKQVTENDGKNDKLLQEMDEKLKSAFLNGVVQSILSRQFSFAEEQLRLYDYNNYKTELENNQNQTNVNFNLLLKFAGSVQNPEIKFKLYEALCNEVISKATLNFQVLPQLSKLLRKEVLQASTDTSANKYRLLDRTLWTEGTNAVATLISFTETLENTNEYVKMMEEFHEKIQRSSNIELLIYAYCEAIKKAPNSDKLNSIFYRSRIWVETELRLLILQCAMNTVEYGGIAGGWELLVYNIDYIKNFLKHENWTVRNQYESVINNLPTSIINLFGSAICIKNFHLDEYFYISDSGEVLTGKPRKAFKPETPKFQWLAHFEGPSLRPFAGIMFSNSQHEDNSFLGVDILGSSVLPLKNEDARSSWAQSTWLFHVNGDGVQLFRNRSADGSAMKYLYANINTRLFSDERDVYVSKSEDFDQPKYSKWEFVDCSDSH